MTRSLGTLFGAFLLLCLISTALGLTCYKCTSSAPDCENPTETDECDNSENNKKCFTRLSNNKPNLKSCKTFTATKLCEEAEPLMCYCDGDKCNDKNHGVKSDPSGPGAGRSAGQGGSGRKVNGGGGGEKGEGQAQSSSQRPFHLSPALLTIIATCWAMNSFLGH